MKLSRALFIVVGLCFYTFFCAWIISRYHHSLIHNESIAFTTTPQLSNGQSLQMRQYFANTQLIPEVESYLLQYFGTTEIYSCDSPVRPTDDLFMAFVDHNRAIDNQFIPNDLVPLPKQYTKASSGVVCMRVEAARAFIDMVADAHKQNLMIVASSGFRSSEVQEFILDGRLKVIGEKAYNRVALPGHSEHQLGVAVDVTSLSVNYDSAAALFGDSVDGKWMAQNAPSYGFIQSYPYGKEYITGYIYEPWHYRYVGTVIAEEIIKRGITLTEYLQERVVE